LQLPDCQIVTRECADENSPGFEPGYFIPTPLLVFILTCPTAYRRTDLHEALHPARTNLLHNAVMPQPFADHGR